MTIDAARAADLLRSRGLVPNRAWGQNFLRDRRLAELDRRSFQDSADALSASSTESGAPS